jgi:tRNA1(Val) A37 N6-methylase TrmN6
MQNLLKRSGKLRAQDKVLDLGAGDGRLLVLYRLMSDNQTPQLHALECTKHLLSGSDFWNFLPKGDRVTGHVGNYSAHGGPTGAKVVISNPPWSMSNPKLTVLALQALSRRVSPDGWGLIIHYEGARELLKKYGELVGDHTW